MNPWVLHLTALEATAGARSALAQQLAADPPRDRTLLLSTCHRVELYGFGERPRAAARLSSGREAVNRLLRVATGLESASLGEDEVLHQLRSAYAAARATGLDDPRLQRLAETAIATGRRARSGGRARTRPLERRAAEWMATRIPMRRVLVVGAGHMGQALAAQATGLGANVRVATRRPAGGQIDLPTAAARAHQFDGVLVALSGSWSVTAADVQAVGAVADLSCPPALPADVRRSLGPRLLGIDDLFATRDEDLEYAARARALVASAASEYLTWLGTRQAGAA